MPSNPYFKRDLVLCGISVLSLIPILLLWHKRSVSPPPLSPYPPLMASSPPMPAMEAIVPTPLPTVTASSTDYGEAQISPDGQLLVRKESGSQMADSLVVRLVKTNQEVFRATDAEEFAGWIPGSQSFVSQKGGDVNVFTAGGKNVRDSSRSWTRRTLSFSPDTRSLTRFSPKEANELDLQTGRVLFSPDFRFAIKSSWGYGQVIWQVADLKTGAMHSPVTAGRWLGYDPNMNISSNNVSAAASPIVLNSSGKPLVVLLQTTEVSPIATSTPVPTPMPTATYSPAQAEFVKRRDKENTKIEDLVAKVEGIDGAEPEVTSKEGIARIAKEVKRRNKALSEEEKRYFPSASANLSNTQRPRASTHKDYWSLFQMECFDLGTGKALWTVPVKSYVFAPRMEFSPDGTSLVVWGTAAFQKQNANDQLGGAGIEFYSPLTGKLMRKTALYEGDFGTQDQNQTAFYESSSPSSPKKKRSIFVVKDMYETPRRLSTRGHTYTVGERHIAFRFFDAASAHEIGHLKLNAQGLAPDDLSFMNFSVSQDGKTWLWGSKDTVAVTRSQLGQENAAPLPTPTAFPSR